MCIEQRSAVSDSCGVPILICSILQLTAPDDLLSGMPAVNECLIGPGVIPSSESAAIMNAQIIEKAMNQGGRLRFLNGAVHGRDVS